MNHTSYWSNKINARGIGNIMRNMEEFCRKIFTELYMVAVFYDFDIKFAGIRKFFLAFVNNCSCERGCIYNRISKLLHYVGECANMIVMSMGKNNRLYILLLAFKVCGIRNNVVNAGGFVLRELKPKVHDDNFVFILEKHLVSAHFFKSS